MYSVSNKYTVFYCLVNIQFNFKGTTMTTQRTIYDLIHFVCKYDNLHLGEDRANRIATQCAVKATWAVMHNSKTIIQFSDASLRYLTKDN